MNRGPKLKNPEHKKLSGTFKQCVDGKTAPLVELANDYPIAPDWLTAGAKEIWATDLARVVAVGARDTDSHFYAIYCEMMARFVAGARAGDPPNAAFVSELRKQCEMMGIAGAKSRLARIGVAQPGDVKPSPFSIRQ